MAHYDDEQLMAELSAAVAERQLVPPGAFEDATGAFQLRGLDQELALLTILYDSLLDQQQSLVRGAAHASIRTMTFTRGEFSLEIEVNEDTIIGQVLPPQSANVTLATRQATVASTGSDAWGSFLLPRPAGGAVRLIWQTGSEKLVTDWFTL